MSDMKMPISMGKYADKDLRKAYVFMARNAEGAERYKDMCKFMKGLVLTGADLTLEERNLFSIGYKNVVGSLRAAWRTVNTEEVKFNDLMKAYRETLEDELQDTCKDALALLEGNLIHAGKTPEAKVFYLKMTGDYYRYLAEFNKSSSYIQKAASFYKQAQSVAEEELEATDPVRLGLALNSSVCFYEILKDKRQACELAKSAFDQAISKLDDLDEASYKDSTLIMQLLRDNLTLWTSLDADVNE